MQANAAAEQGLAGGGRGEVEIEVPAKQQAEPTNERQIRAPEREIEARRAFRRKLDLSGEREGLAARLRDDVASSSVRPATSRSAVMSCSAPSTPMGREAALRSASVPSKSAPGLSLRSSSIRPCGAR